LADILPTTACTLFGNDCTSGTAPLPTCEPGWRCDKIYTEGTTCQETWPGSKTQSCKLTSTSTSANGTCCIPPGTTGGTNPSPTSTSKTPPPGTTISCQCDLIRAYDTDWNELNSSALSQLKAGDTVRFAVSGNTNSGAIDMARFTINGTLRAPVTQKNPSGEYYDEYTIPDGTTSFTINAELHHTSPEIGWF
jgi:hypothetical protein